MTTRGGAHSASTTQLLAPAEFDLLYQRGVDDILRFWTPSMQEEIARHNCGWATGRIDFVAYLRASSARYYRAYRSLAAGGGASRVCDIGGFWGAFPLVLRRLGYPVTMTEALQYYSESFTPLFAFVAGQGVEILDHDPFVAGAAVGRTFDYVTVMAVLEHYPHSLRPFLTNVTAMMSADAELYVEVPNIAFWPKRVAMLRGRTPLVPVRDVYTSETPFLGHHHEYTIAELRDLAPLAGLRLIAVNAFNYTPGLIPSFRFLLRHPVSCLAFALAPAAREVLAARYRRAGGAP